MRAQRVLASFLQEWLLPVGDSLAVLALLGLWYPSSARGQGTDEIHAAQLGERGVVFESPEEGVRLGFADFVGFRDGQGIGDLNGDGFDDIALCFFDGLNRNQFPLYHVMVLYGRPRLTGRQTLAFDGTFPGSLVIKGEDPDARYAAFNIRRIGDLNGDGRSELMFGYEQVYPEGGMGAGMAFLIWGSTGLEGLGFVEEVIRGDVPGVAFFSSDPEHGSVGSVTASLGDINGDGDDDLAISAPYSSVSDRIGGGVVFVLLEAHNLPRRVDLTEVGKSVPGFQIHGRSQEFDSGPRGSLGTDMAPAGDFNGDGLDDFFLTAIDLYPDHVYLLEGRRQYPPVLDMVEAEGKAGTTIFFVPGNSLWMGHSRQSTGVGDVNGDGYDDILLGAPRPGSTLGGGGNPSLVRLIYGGSKLPPKVDFTAVPPGLSTTIHGLQNTVVADKFGSALGPAGDLNGDGIPDLLIGAHGAGGTGEAYAILGRRDFGPDLFLAEGFDGLRIVGETESGDLGDVVASAGDFDGDGRGDILVIAPQRWRDSFPFPARAYVIYGTGGDEPPFTFLNVQPLWGPLRGGTEVTLRGSGFKAPLSVRFGGVEATDVTVASAVEIRARTPPGAGVGPVDVSVVASGGERSLGDAFEYTPDFPEIDLDRLGNSGFVLDGRGELDLGDSVAFVDLDGDGTDELIAESNFGDILQIIIVHGAADLPPSLPAFEPSPLLTIITSSERDGGFVGAVGDVNADGIEDLGVVLGPAWAVDLGPVAYVLFGRQDLPERIVLEEESLRGGAVRLERGGPISARPPFAAAIASAGDLDADGIGDLVLSFPDGPRDTIPQAGEILFLAGRRAWPSTLDLQRTDEYMGRLTGARANEQFGEKLLQVGDVNGDGRVDFLVDGWSDAGIETVYVIYGRTEMPRDLDVLSYLKQPGAGVEIRILIKNPLSGLIGMAAPGDVDGDGFADMLVGISLAGPNGQGVSFLIHGQAEMPAVLEIGDKEPQARIVKLLGEDVTVGAGKVGPAGDFDGDGIVEFLVAASSRPPVENGINPGRLFIVLGGHELPATLDLARFGGRGIRVDGLVVYGIGLPASNTGDLNADGRPDFSFREADKLYVLYGLPRSQAFVRGETDGDAAVNLTDVIFLLQHLFLGGSRPHCMDGADADDSGAVGITDAIYLLRHLFQGGDPPPAPYPAPGLDPTVDNLGC